MFMATTTDGHKIKPSQTIPLSFTGRSNIQDFTKK